MPEVRLTQITNHTSAPNVTKTTIHPAKVFMTAGSRLSSAALCRGLSRPDFNSPAYWGSAMILASDLVASSAARSRSPSRMAGTMSLRIISPATMSGTTPSMPYPVCMRARRLPGEIRSSSPLSRSLAPRPQRVNRRSENSSTGISPIEGTMATATSASVESRKARRRMLMRCLTEGESIPSGSATNSR